MLVTSLPCLLVQNRGLCPNLLCLNLFITRGVAVVGPHVVVVSSQDAGTRSDPEKPLA